MNNKNIIEQFLGFYKTSSLFIDDIQGIKNFEFEEIDLNILDYSKLEINEKIPLGKRIERFFEFYIENSSRYKIILKNIQIIENKNTLGEIDFILFDNKKKEFIHLELVYKFYIYDNRFPKELQKYIGANRNDTLLRKLNKLKEKQFPLLYRKETKKYLSNININEIKQQVCYKANLFYQEEIFNNKYDFINNQCKKGFYINYKQFIAENKFKEYFYYIPHRYDWISSFNIADEWQNYYRTVSTVDTYYNMKKSPLLWLKDKEKIIPIFVTFL